MMGCESMGSNTGSSQCRFSSVGLNIIRDVYHNIYSSSKMAEPGRRRVTFHILSCDVTFFISYSQYFKTVSNKKVSRAWIK